MKCSICGSLNLKIISEYFKFSGRNKTKKVRCRVWSCGKCGRIKTERL